MIEQIECGAAQSAAITEDGQLYIWGFMHHQPSFTPQRVRDFVPSHRVSAVCLGAYHVLALAESDSDPRRVYSWGSGAKGQLGHGDTNDVVVPRVIGAIEHFNVLRIACGENTSAVLTGMPASSMIPLDRSFDRSRM